MHWLKLIVNDDDNDGDDDDAILARDAFSFDLLTASPSVSLLQNLQCQTFSSTYEPKLSSHF